MIFMISNLYMPLANITVFKKWFKPEIKFDTSVPFTRIRLFQKQ
jgi:hypothetical protein